MTITEKIRQALFEMRDDAYRDFQCTLMPTVPPETVIGVRTPQLRALAKKLYRETEIDSFLADLPHIYYEENTLHGFLIECIQDFDACTEALNRFLPFVNNWATCDSIRPKCLTKHKEPLLEHIERWLTSGHIYMVRYGIGMLMVHFLDEDFRRCYLARVAVIRSDEYYINMMIAWYFATALAKQYACALVYLEENRLPLWVHNKTIQKAVESYRITPEQKKYLRTLRRKV